MMIIMPPYIEYLLSYYAPGTGVSYLQRSNHGIPSNTSVIPFDVCGN